IDMYFRASSTCSTDSSFPLLRFSQTFTALSAELFSGSLDTLLKENPSSQQYDSSWSSRYPFLASSSHSPLERSTSSITLCQLTAPDSSLALQTRFRLFWILSVIPD